MATIDSTFGKKELTKQASLSEQSSLTAAGEKARVINGAVVMDSVTKSAIDGATDPTILINDEAEFLRAKFYLNQIEELRAEIAKLHAFVKDIAGTDSSSDKHTGSQVVQINTKGATVTIEVSKGLITSIK